MPARDLWGFRFPEKIDNFWKKSRKHKIDWLPWKLKNENNIMGWRGTLRVLRAETWLTVYRTIAIREQCLSRADLGPHKMMNQCRILSSYQGFARWHSRKPTENLVERILKINRDMIKCKKENARARLMGFQISGKFWKIENFKKNLDFFWKFQIFKNLLE